MTKSCNLVRGFAQTFVERFHSLRLQLKGLAALLVNGVLDDCAHLRAVVVGGAAELRRNGTARFDDRHITVNVRVNQRRTFAAFVFEAANGEFNRSAKTNVGRSGAGWCSGNLRKERRNLPVYYFGLDGKFAGSVSKPEADCAKSEPADKEPMPAMMNSFQRLKSGG